MLYEIALTYIPGIGNRTARKLVNHFASAEKIFSSTRKELLEVEGIRKNVVDAILSQKLLSKVEKELKLIEKYKIKVLSFKSKNYPQRLLHCIDAPSVLYYKGNADLNPSKILAVVGTRKATDYGKSVCQEIIKHFPDEVLILSGLAAGIDTCAHQKALEYTHPTVGVLGHGLDRIYPAQNRKLAERMLANGGLLTEFPFETNPDRENFPQRNRLVAGMADAVLVVESAKRGGALITAEIANSYNRDVFAIPARVGDTQSQGCHFLIRSNRAALVTSAKDIMSLMSWDQKDEKVIQRKLFIELSDEQQLVFDLINKEKEVFIDKLLESSKLNYGKLTSILLDLELQGVVDSLPGKRYRIC